MGTSTSLEVESLFSYNGDRVSIQLISPASGDKHGNYCCFFHISVSIQLISPASGDKEDIDERINELEVSIQLISPASGDPNAVYSSDDTI